MILRAGYFNLHCLVCPVQKVSFGFSLFCTFITVSLCLVADVSISKVDSSVQDASNMPHLTHLVANSFIKTQKWLYVNMLIWLIGYRLYGYMRKSRETFLPHELYSVLIRFWLAIWPFGPSWPD